MGSGLWLQIDISQAGAGLRATARSSRGEEPPAHMLGPPSSSELILQFSKWVKEAASRATPLAPLAQSQALYQALFQHGLQQTLHQLHGSARGEPILLRLNPGDNALHGVPWEALCRPETTVDFLGTSQEVCLARGASSLKPWEPCRIEDAVRLLVISPSDTSAPSRLESVLRPSLDAKELKWLTPLTGSLASAAYLFSRLRLSPIPHILHFIGHGGLDSQGHPTLQLTPKDEQDPWLKVELLAKELEPHTRDTLRLVVLEACEGASPGALASAAARLVEAGVGAVVAHLWPVRADIAQRCSAVFYRSLLGTATHRGNVARSLHDARRTLLAEFHESAEAFSPVLYLRGHEPILFNFPARKPRPPSFLAPAAQRSEVEPSGHTSDPSGRVEWAVMTHDNRGGFSRSREIATDAPLPSFASAELWLSCPEPDAFSFERLAQPLEEAYGARAHSPSTQGSKLLLPLKLPREKLPRLIQDAESCRLDTLFAQGGAKFVQEICEGNRCLYQHLPAVTFLPSLQCKWVDSGTLRKLLPEVDVVLLTTTEIERDALYEVMRPFPGYSGLVGGALQHNTYRLGRFGRYLAAHVESTMGSQARHGSTLTVHDAIAELSPKAVVILGIAFGMSPVTQRLGDVIIAETVIPYELQRVGQRAISRGQHLPCGPILSERFRTRRPGWKLERGEDTVKVFQGPLLSGEKLTDNLAFRDALAEAFPGACGGEMEGVGAYAATERRDVEVILVKAICDWGDGHKTDWAQPFAAKAAVSLAHYVLDTPAVLEALHARDYEPQEAAAPSPGPKHTALRPAQDDPAVRSLMNLLQQPFSLLLGDNWRLTKERLRLLLHARLRETQWSLPESSSLSELAQVYALRFGNEALGMQLRNATSSRELIDALAQRLPPGVHVTLQRLPVLEQALTQKQPGRPLFVIQPSRPEEGVALIRRHDAGQGWSSLDALPDSSELKSAVLLLRLYQGFPDQMFDRRLHVEDGFLLGTWGLESMLPPKLADTLLSGLHYRPTLLLGLSLSMRDHQLALHYLFGHRPLPRRSMVLLEPDGAEALPWQDGRELPGGAGLQAVQAETAELAKLLSMAGQEIPS